MDNKIKNLLLNPDLANIKLGLLLARNEGYPEYAILEEMFRRSKYGELELRINNLEYTEITDGILGWKSMNVLIWSNRDCKRISKDCTRQDSINLAIKENEIAKIFLNLVLNSDDN